MYLGCDTEWFVTHNEAFCKLKAISILSVGQPGIETITFYLQVLLLTSIRS